MVAEVLQAISIAILVICSAFYLRHLEKTKKKSKLTTFEFAIYVIIQIALMM